MGEGDEVAWAPKLTWTNMSLPVNTCRWIPLPPPWRRGSRVFCTRACRDVPSCPDTLLAHNHLSFSISIPDRSRPHFHHPRVMYPLPRAGSWPSDQPRRDEKVLVLIKEIEIIYNIFSNLKNRYISLKSILLSGLPSTIDQRSPTRHSQLRMLSSLNSINITSLSNWIISNRFYSLVNKIKLFFKKLIKI